MSCEDLDRTERERDEALAEVEHMRRGIEAYRWYERNLPSILVVKTDNDVKELDAACDSITAWEREDKKRNESGDE